MRKIINVVKRNKALGAARRKKRNKIKLEEGEVAEKTRKYEEKGSKKQRDSDGRSKTKKTLNRNLKI